MTKRSFRLFALIAGFLVLGAASYNLYRLWNQPPDRYWTPRQFAGDLAEVTSRAEVLLKGDSLQRALAEGRVTINDATGPLTIQPTDVTVRLNNYDQVRVRRVPAALVSAGAAGGALVLLLLGLFAPALGGALPPSRELAQLHLAQG
jgi:hypothetical protein